jgi:glycosyltransferase involved in cell wall biosynthesis
VQTNLVSIRDFLRRHGASASVINITRHRKPDADEVYYPASPAALLKLLYTLPYDVVHIHAGGQLPTRVLMLMLACATVPGRRSVFTFHSGGFPSSPEGLAAQPSSLLGRVLRRFDAVTGVNAQLIEFFGRMQLRPERVHLVAPHSFGPELETVAARGRDALPTPLRRFFAEHGPVLLSVGLLETEYDLALQIDTLGAVRERFPNAGLVMIGSGSLEGELRARIAAAPWGAHALLCGDVAREHTLVAIRECDALLRTTHYDGDAISVREALHLGTPVIASDNGMRPAGARLVPARDAEALVAAIARTLTDTMGAPRRVASGGEENLVRMVRIYESLTGERVLGPEAPAVRAPGVHGLEEARSAAPR